MEKKMQTQIKIRNRVFETDKGRIKIRQGEKVESLDDLVAKNKNGGSDKLLLALGFLKI